MNKILLVGGAGYIGSVLASELLERGYAVKVLDRLYYGDDGLRGIRDRVELIVCDMRAIPPAALEDVEAVVNMGGLSNDPTAEYNPEANYAMNTSASVKLAELCMAHGIRRYVFASSCSIYDRGVGNDERDVVQDETSEVDPKAAYSGSKRAAEKALLTMTSDRFCPVILRKGTVYGFSPRMRYDLVVNTFVKDALSRGVIMLHAGGEMWRPLVDVHDVARAYLACLNAEEDQVRGQIFNLLFRNFRIAELALRVRQALKEVGVVCDIHADYGYKGVRSYRVSAKKIEHLLNVHPTVTVEESVRDMVENIRRFGHTDFENPKYYNIRWMRLLEEAHKIVAVTGSVFDVGTPSV
jgi:nucleoside-diphosphate-sugar epimerase